MTESNIKEVFSIEDSAAYVGISVQTFRKLVYSDRAVQPVFTRSELNRLIKARQMRRVKHRASDIPTRRIKALEDEVTDLKERVRKLERQDELNNRLVEHPKRVIGINIDDLPDVLPDGTVIHGKRK